MTHDDDVDHAPYDVDGHIDGAHDDAWSGDWWQIPVAVLLWCVIVWFFLGGLRGLILFAPFTIWVLLCLVLRLGLSVFLGFCIMTIVSIILLFLLFA